MRYIFLLLIPLTSLAEIKTTGNLIVNGNFETGNTNGWTVNGDVQVMNDCCSNNNSQYDLEFGDSGTISQQFKLYSDTVTEQMLDNGHTKITSSILSQNGEGGSYPAWNRNGDADSWTVKLEIKDNNSNVLNSVTQTRTDTTDIYGIVYTNSVSYTGAGSRVGNIEISSQDASAPAFMGSTNIDDVSVVLEYDDTVLTAVQTQAIQSTFTELEEVIELTEEFIPEEVENLVIEEIVLEEVITELPVIIETFEMTEEEEFIQETLVLAPEIIQETEIVETEEIVEETIEVAEEVFEEIVAAPVEESNIEETNETEIVEETERDTDVVESNETAVAEETETQDNDRSVETELTVDVADITAKVQEKIKTTEGQLKAVSLIVAKVMSQNNSKINAYSQVNAEIFKQPVIMDRNIDTYINQTYVDVRNIYNDRTYEDRQDWISR